MTIAVLGTGSESVVPPGGGWIPPRWTLGRWWGPVLGLGTVTPQFNGTVGRIGLELEISSGQDFYFTIDRANNINILYNYCINIWIGNLHSQHQANSFTRDVINKSHGIP